ncbi:hypothetical protein CCM_06289 [Cordyceps militaris CM01]|uniref:Uncharacterized protein n=1 Tax=Cordyceps militaris (strain CM01) TaxID=983644 RepID=G3JJU5_CORMM|nr:uncharacterized protein CCM_06289 [Cordyceps militaris CM01]EGX92129.1 hypothetical protein CCM_06289 [Cordyceps militaris CM01]
MSKNVASPSIPAIDMDMHDSPPSSAPPRRFLQHGAPMLTSLPPRRIQLSLGNRAAPASVGDGRKCPDVRVAAGDQPAAPPMPRTAPPLVSWRRSDWTTALRHLSSTAWRRTCPARPGEELTRLAP